MEKERDELEVLCGVFLRRIGLERCHALFVAQKAAKKEGIGAQLLFLRTKSILVGLGFSLVGWKKMRTRDVE